MAAAALTLHDLGDHAVARGQLERLLDEAAEPGPGVLRRERPLAGSDDLLEGFLENGVDQVVARGEVAVQRADADARLACDLPNRDVGAVAGEQRQRRGDEPGAVPLRVDAFGDRHRGTVAKAERVIRLWRPAAAERRAELEAEAL